MSLRVRSAFAAAVLAAVLIAVVGPGAGRPAVAAGPVQLKPAITGLASPVYVTSARDGSGRLFVLEQGGVIKLLRPGQRTATVYLDIRDKVLSGGERGLLGLAFHPSFATNGRFFVYYTRKPDGATVVADYVASPPSAIAVTGAGNVRLVVAQPFANHNGGMIEFGHDGFLYIGKGDGGSGNDPDNRAQNVNDLHGKILRIDVSGARGYTSPPDNPFAGATAGRDEIFAFGLRNPFRFSFDRLTGDLYAGDVGQGQVEEIDIIRNGGNYGWRIWEGSLCSGNDPGLCSTAGFTFPIAEYEHTGARCAVIGGYVYRGTAGTLPAGSYVYGDLCSGEIFLLDNGASRVLLQTDFSISSFGEDEAGEIYVVNIGGVVNRITAATTSPCGISVAPAARSVSGKAATTGQLRVTAATGCPWDAVSTAPWIAITGKASGAGRGAVNYSIARNPGAGARTGTIEVGGAVFTVTQSGRARRAAAAGPGS